MDALAPGRTLDAAIAEKVMGEPKPTGNVPDGVLAGVTTSSSDGGNWIGTTTGYTAGDEPVWLPKPYSTEISPAWEVVEKLKADHIEPLIECDEEDQAVSREAATWAWLVSRLVYAAPAAGGRGRFRDLGSGAISLLVHLGPNPGLLGSRTDPAEHRSVAGAARVCHGPNLYGCRAADAPAKRVGLRFPVGGGGYSGL